LITMPAKLGMTGALLAGLGLGLALVLVSVQRVDPPGGDTPAAAGPRPGTGLSAGGPVSAAASTDEKRAAHPPLAGGGQLRIAGRVMRSPSEPYAGARVRVQSWNGYDADGEALSTYVTADAAGHFQW